MKKNFIKRFIEEFISRTKYGYPIGAEYRYTYVTKHEIRIWYKDEISYDIYTDDLPGNKIIIYADRLSFGTDKIYSNAIEQLIIDFKKNKIDATIVYNTRVTGGPPPLPN